MALTNIAMYVVTVLLTHGPSLTHAGCDPWQCHPRLKLSFFPSSVDGGQCLRCSSMSQDSLVAELRNQMKYNIDGFITRNINISNILITDQRILNLSFIEINHNNKNMNFSFIKNFTELRYFGVHYSNTLNEFKGYYVSTQSYLTINFQNNNVKTIKSLCQGYYHPAWRLNLANNEIKFFTKVNIGHSNCTSKLRWLNLSYNNLTSLFADIFLQLPALEFFDISHNQISEFEKNFNNSSSLIKLKYLDMGYNKLSKLNEETFKYLFNLETLTLNDNNIKYLPVNVLSDLSKLKKLDLSTNLFSYLNPQIFSKLNELENLDIRGNLLVMFDLQYFQTTLNSLRDINLIGNKWDCAELTYLITYLNSKRVSYWNFKEPNISISNVANINCITSNALRDSLLSKENVIFEFMKRISQLENDVSRKHVQVTVMLVVIVVFIVVLCMGGVYVRLRRSRGAGGVRVDRERAPGRRQEPLYHYVQSLGVQHNWESYIYTELHDILPSIIPAEEHADSERAPARRQEPGVHHSRESHIYEEPLYISPSVIREASMCSDNSLYGESPDKTATGPQVNHITSSPTDKRGSVCSDNSLYGVSETATVPVHQKVTPSSTAPSEPVKFHSLPEEA